MNEPGLMLRWQQAPEAGQLLDREWLVTNGLGGYASGSLAGGNTRKYHGLFVPNLNAPKGRHVLLSRCDESVIVGEREYALHDVEFVGDGLRGGGHRWLRSFGFDRSIARWTFQFDDIVLEKSIVMVHLNNTVCVRYRIIEGSAAVLRLRPVLAFRRHDQLRASPEAERFSLHQERGRLEMRLADSPMVLRMVTRPGPASFTPGAREDHELCYRIDRARGEAATESLFSPGHFDVPIGTGSTGSRYLIASSNDWRQMDVDASTLFDAECRRIDDLHARAGIDRDDTFAQRLITAADQFIVLPGSRLEESVKAQSQGGDFRSIYAGYQWFGDWGRDTMISLEGLTLCTGRQAEAGAILRTFARYVHDGLLPNLFPEGERKALYHTVDATLWYFHAIDRYVAISGDRDIVRELFPILQSIIERHIAGTHYGIGMDPADALVHAGAEGYQLTWMDAKVDGWVVTPRRGKPVEIQALWHNALCLMNDWAQALGRRGDEYAQHAHRAKAAFNARYWNDGTRCLFDVIDGPQGDDPAIRPNQIFAMSLTHPVLDRQRWTAVMDTVTDKLLTPFGLRTLSADNPDYKSRYQGDLLARDAAYHQGTVWPWLIGHYVDVWLRLHDEPVTARRLLMAFPDHLRDAGIGSISEIFDADLPHVAGGCMAQAWSVAEVLRAWLKTRA
jgi:predicted glycogen debranching enzyme